MSEFAKIFNPADCNQVLVVRTQLEDPKDGIIPCLKVLTEVEGDTMEMIIEAPDRDAVQKLFESFGEQQAREIHDVLHQCYLDDIPGERISE